MRIFVTGGAGFIGSALIRYLIAETEHEVLNYDALTYAGTLSTVAGVADDPRYRFIRADVRDSEAVRKALDDFRPNVITHLAAESHVDRSIDGPGAFIDTNLVGTYTMLTEARRYWQQLPKAERSAFRFHHISTDEVYGSLGAEGLFTEETPYDPRSPYSASKAGADHLVSAWGHTYGLPVLITNCSNKVDRDAAIILAATTKNRTSRWFEPSARIWTSSARERTVVCTPSKSCTWLTARVMICAMRSMPRGSARNWVGSPRRPSKAASVKRLSGISAIRLGGALSSI